MIANGVSSSQSATAAPPYTQTPSPVRGIWEYGAQPGTPWGYSPQMGTPWGYTGLMGPQWGYSPQMGAPWGYTPQPNDPRYGNLIGIDPRFGLPFAAYDPRYGNSVGIDPRFGTPFAYDPRYGVAPVGPRFGTPFADPRFGTPLTFDPRFGTTVPSYDPRFGPAVSPFDPRFESPAFGLGIDQYAPTVDPRFVNRGAMSGMGFGFEGQLPQYPISPAQQPGIFGLPRDEEIEEMAQQALDYHPLIPLDADVDVRCESGQVTLTGKVPDKRIKRAAGEAIWWIPGVTDVNNTIVVSGRRQAQASRRRGRQQPIPAAR